MHLHKFPLLNGLQKISGKQTPNARIRLELLKQSAKEYIAIHNQVVHTLHEVEVQLKELKLELAELNEILELSPVQAEEKKYLIADITELTYRQTILKDSLTRNRSAQLIKEKLAEIRMLELKVL